VHTDEANYTETRSIARPLCDSTAILVHQNLQVFGQNLPAFAPYHGPNFFTKPIPNEACNGVGTSLIRMNSVYFAVFAIVVPYVLNV